MSLFAKTQPASDFNRLSKLIYGFPKTGKTTLASLMVDVQGRKPAFIASEDGHGALSIEAQRITSWIGFVKLLNDIKSTQEVIKAEHSCFVLDLVADIDDMCVKHICDKFHVGALGDMDHGKGWFIHKTIFRAAMMELLGILPCVFICHSELKEDIKTKVVRNDPQMSKQCSAFVNGKVDLIMWIQPSINGLPQIVMKPTIQLNAGSRFPQMIRNFDYNVKDPAASVKEMCKVFAERLGDDSTTVQKE